ncbi:MAG: carboxylating nicotinate-nucleotide diphosphorylase [Spirochaetales bacterium]|nr:carboxylating nicotinate-nucleotide diphosphorylase [Spirochaetales bacterium]
MEQLHPLQYEELIKNEIRADIGFAGDLTTSFFVPADRNISSSITPRQEGVLAGIDIALFAFRVVSSEIVFEKHLEDGSPVKAGDRVATVSGPARAILTAERTALNVLTHLCGIATMTNRMVKAVEGTRARITDTRKTLPGLRALQKYAVRCGGGVNHRFGLDGAVMIKDNHLAGFASWEEGILALKKKLGHTVKVEVEVDTLEQLKRLIGLPVDIVLLDNMTPDQLREAVQLVDRRMITEASGNVSLETVRGIAEAGVDIISSGALTHSVQALDLGLDFHS